MNSYPVFIPSKGRYDNCLTADMMIKDKMFFFIVVEPQEFNLYNKKYNKKYLLKLPFSNLNKGVYPARNWIKEYANKNGYKYHWQFDDDMKTLAYYTNGKQHKKPSSYILPLIENFVNKYKNIGVASITSSAFAFSKKTPYGLNKMVYGCFLYKSDLPYKFRLKLGNDTDMSLQVLEGGWCTVAMNAFVFNTQPLGTGKGGNDTMYANNGRETRANALKNNFPHLPIKVTTRFGRPHHDLSQVWKRYKQQLIKK